MTIRMMITVDLIESLESIFFSSIHAPVIH